jgi:holliday junction DNA helicase RuvB
MLLCKEIERCILAIISDDDNTKKTPKPAKNEDTKAEEINYDMSFETNIRPKKFCDYIGQSALKSTLQISIEAAKKRELPLDHILFYGPPGLGKTTLASVIANEMGANIKITSAPSLERPRDIIGILMTLKANDVLFIDEIHRLNKISEEILYPAMEDFYLDMTTGKSQTLKSMRIPIPKFTLIGATTKAGALSGPLRDRFGIIHRLEFYSQEELTKVVKRTAKILETDIDEKGANAIARRSRGTPRIANRLVKRVRDYATVKTNGIIDEKTANSALDILQIDKFGLDNTDRALIDIIANKYAGGPVGIETLATALGEDVKTIEDVYEPYLVQQGFIQRTPRGRKLTPYACNCFKLNNIDFQQSLF